MYDVQADKRFHDLLPLKEKVWLSSPTMHGPELAYMIEAYRTNWMSTVGNNIDETERMLACFVGAENAVCLSCGTAALHLALRLAGERLYGVHRAKEGTLSGRRVFCSDMTFSATVNPVAYEGGEAVFIETEYDTWNMDPAALRKAFETYPDTRLVVLAHLYGTPGKIDEIRDICKAYGALLVEDAAESMGAVYKGRQTGSFGDYGIVSFNGNKIITGSSGGALLTDSKPDADKVRKWSTQSREAALWYQHEELGYNYRMSNVIAGVVRGQMEYIDVHIAKKKAIYERYQEGLSDLPVRMNPLGNDSIPNYWLSCMTVDPSAMCEAVRSERGRLYRHSKGKTCPDEILDVLAGFRIEGRPIWKPMHLQALYRGNNFVREGTVSVGEDIFARGLCLPSDVKMTEEEQDVVIEIIRRCFE
ncbi:MAG: aminotransferase class V-fold PLP-dependent enzyme [Dorea sp.]|jgi:dTDP-4-amino-4,6-dideoxygalactose transaminase|nr:aminotransferase class V-fold PLP-dependent enzyme [Dorea sp.]